MSVPAADWRAAKSLLRSSMDSRSLMLIVLIWSDFRIHESFSVRAPADNKPTITANRLSDVLSECDRMMLDIDPV
jgi:hypothetical protein